MSKGCLTCVKRYYDTRQQISYNEKLTGKAVYRVMLNPAAAAAGR